jgi:hypothetical protein
MVTGRGDASNIKLDAFREMVELCPSLGLLGGCANNRVIPGRTIVDDAMLICRETKHLMPDWVLEVAGELDTCRSHVEVEQRVRMDPMLDPAKQKLLSAGAQVKQLQKMAASEEAHDSDDAVLRDDTKSTMMPRTFETIARGSLLYWTVTVTCLSDIDVDTAHTMIAAFLSNARVGGKRGTGHGAIRPIQARGVVVNRPSDPRTTVQPNALAPKMGEMFRAHVKARQKRIHEFLAGVDA